MNNEELINYVEAGPVSAQENKYATNPVGACNARPQEEENNANAVGAKSISTQMKSYNAITIVSLVITIIILLILAGVTLSLTIGEHGIFKTAKKAAENYTNSQEREIAEINRFTNSLVNYDVSSGGNNQILNQEDILNLVNQIQDMKKEIEELKNNTSSSNMELDKIYPVGSIYISTDLSTSEAVSNKIGGTWESYGQGRTLIGVGTGTDENSVSQTFAVNETRGEYKHTLSIAEMPKHNHQTRVWVPAAFNESSIVSGRWKGLAGIRCEGYYSEIINTYTEGGVIDGGGTGVLSSGGSQSHNNIQPYIAVYMWKRIN